MYPEACRRRSSCTFPWRPSSTAWSAPGPHTRSVPGKVLVRPPLPQTLRAREGPNKYAPCFRGQSCCCCCGWGGRRRAAGSPVRWVGMQIAAGSIPGVRHVSGEWLIVIGGLSHFCCGGLVFYLVSGTALVCSSARAGRGAVELACSVPTLQVHRRRTTCSHAHEKTQAIGAQYKRADWFHWQAPFSHSWTHTTPAVKGRYSQAVFTPLSLNNFLAATPRRHLKRTYFAVCVLVDAC